MTRLILLAVLLALGACNKKEPAPSGTSSASAAATEQRSGLLSVGDKAPDIQATAHNGTAVKLRELAGKPVVVYFYPKDDTPGCTVEAQGLRDEWSGLETTGAVVIGVSTDDNASHKAFAEKHSLPFLLLPDPKGEIAQAFGVPVTLGYAKRVTFVIGKNGNITKVFSDVSPKGHAKEVLAAIQAS